MNWAIPVWAQCDSSWRLRQQSVVLVLLAELFSSPDRLSNHSPLDRALHCEVVTDLFQKGQAVLILDVLKIRV